MRSCRSLLTPDGAVPGRERATDYVKPPTTLPEDVSTDDPATGAHTLSSPSAAAAADLVADGIEAGALVTLFGRCTVDYEGRAASELGPGDRHVMLKPDGAASGPRRCGPAPRRRVSA